ncbi:MAG: EutN/CcmL family microcompartment protein [Armatimonadetes bacterium]|nr:EutN/CcmL family microcompartment protein [Armatimonadota bacterium]
MIICKVIGTIVCTQKDEKLTGAKLQLVLPMDTKTFQPDGRPLVAVDSIGAGQGEMVLVVSGSSARLTARTQNTPVDAVIMGIIDTIEIEGMLTFEKHRDGQ